MTANEKLLVQVTCFLFAVHGSAAVSRALDHVTRGLPLPEQTEKARLDRLGVSEEFVNGVVCALEAKDPPRTTEGERGYASTLIFFREGATIA